MAAGRAVIAHDAAATTKIPVASAAAGRSQPSRPARSGSGRNRSTTAPPRYRIQMTTGSSHRHSEPRTPAGLDAVQLACGRLAGGDLGADPVEAVPGRLHRVNREAQRVPQHALQAGLTRVRATMAHDSRSRTERSDAIARDVWLFTAPRVMPIAAAICASDRSP